MVLLGISLIPRASFLSTGNWLSGHASLLSFQTQQEQTVFIRWEVEKAVAGVQKKNNRAKR